MYVAIHRVGHRGRISYQGQLAVVVCIAFLENGEHTIHRQLLLQRRRQRILSKRRDPPLESVHVSIWLMMMVMMMMTCHDRLQLIIRERPVVLLVDDVVHGLLGERAEGLEELLRLLLHLLCGRKKRTCECTKRGKARRELKHPHPCRGNRCCPDPSP